MENQSKRVLLYILHRMRHFFVCSFCKTILYISYNTFLPGAL